MGYSIFLAQGGPTRQLELNTGRDKGGILQPVLS